MAQTELGECRIANVFTKADADLFAEAPALLAALHACRGALNSMVDSGAIPKGLFDLSRLDATIARAEGRQP